MRNPRGRLAQAVSWPGEISSYMPSAGEIHVAESRRSRWHADSVGFFLDSYDLFIINLVTPIWTYEYWGGLAHPPKETPTYPLLLRGAVNAAANIGNIIGQLSFGFLGDAFGRKFVYGKEMIIMIVGVILVISLPNNLKGPTRNKFWYLFGMRVLMGIGIGGDYPMSASIVAERSSLRNRGRMLGWIFSNQGWVSLKPR